MGLSALIVNEQHVSIEISNPQRATLVSVRHPGHYGVTAINLLHAAMLQPASWIYTPASTDLAKH